jgi:transposase
MMDLCCFRKGDSMMQANFRISSLVPPGMAVHSVNLSSDKLALEVSGTADRGCCPLCGSASGRVHSQYVRRVCDYPCSGRGVEFHITTRRFVCDVPQCSRRIFAERFGEGVLADRSRRTARLDRLVYHLGLAPGGKPAAWLSRRLTIPVSHDTVLRVVRRHTRAPTETLNVVGIDDWAWRRNYPYGSIVCDLERRRNVALLPDREMATVAAWLSDHPGITVISRDRSGGYGEAAARALPNAMQVADRWHLMENASGAFLDAVRKSMRDIRRSVGNSTVESALLTRAERLQYEGYLRREEISKSVTAMRDAGLSRKEIVRRSGLSRGTVRKIARGIQTDVFRVRASSLEAYLLDLGALWMEGCHNGAELWRRLKTRGFRGSLRVVTEWTTRRRRADQLCLSELQRIPSARKIARMMTTSRNNLTKTDAVIVANIETSLPALATARALLDRFQTMIRTRNASDLSPWISDARSSLIASFGNGVAKDIDAIRNAIDQPWSSGQVEGQINRLKMVKRQMYGRAKIDLLQARLVGPS